MRTPTIFTTILVMLAPVALPAGAQLAMAPPADLRNNAALDYQRAIYFMERRTDRQKQIVNSYDSPQIDHDAAAQFLNSASFALNLIHRAAKQMWCDWGLRLDQDGPRTLLPYLNGIRRMAEVMLLESRVKLQDGDDSAAVDDWFCALAIGRHAGCNGIPVALLVDYGVEAMVATNAALDLNRLDEPALTSLSAELEKLPPGGTLAQAAQVEQEITQRWILRKLQRPGGQNPNDSLKKLLQAVAGPSLANERVDAALAACGGTADGLAQRLLALEPLYARIASTIALPYDQFVKQWPDLQHDIDADPVARVIIMSRYPQLVRSHAMAQAQLAMFEAAIDVVRKGPDALQSHPDPFGNGPFTYRQTPRGFELTSALIDEASASRPVTLRIGRDSR